MKKLPYLLIILSLPVKAALITHTDYVSGNVITASGQNANENTIVNEINGDLDNSNIAASAAIAVSKLASVGASKLVFSDASGFLTTSAGSYTTTSSFTITGAVTLSSATITGAHDGTNASSGTIGEYFSDSLTGQNVNTSNTRQDMRSLTLPPGDWDVSALGVVNIGTVGTGWTQFNVGISTTSGNSTAGMTVGDNDSSFIFAQTQTVPSQMSLAVPTFRISTSVSEVVYLKVLVIWAGTGNPTFSGRISARRAR